MLGTCGHESMRQAAWFFAAVSGRVVFHSWASSGSNYWAAWFFIAVSGRVGEEGQTNADMKGIRRQRRRGNYGGRKICPQSRETATASRGR